MQVAADRWCRWCFKPDAVVELEAMIVVMRGTGSRVPKYRALWEETFSQGILVIAKKAGVWEGKADI